MVKIYEIDPLMCPKCGSEMKVNAVIKEPEDIKRILRHPRMHDRAAIRKIATRLIKIGRPPPGFDAVRLN